MNQPLPEGRLLLTGPSHAGKTRRTAELLAHWLDARGPDGVVVFDFAPDRQLPDRVVGRPLTAFLEPPEGVTWTTVATHAPRLDCRDAEDAVRLAAENGRRADMALAAAPPDPRVVVVNDATIPYQAPGRDPTSLMDYSDGAALVILNALASDELGTDDPVSIQERVVLRRLRAWADYEHRLPPPDARFMTRPDDDEATRR